MLAKEQNLESYHWCVVSRDGVCGFVEVYPTHPKTVGRLQFFRLFMPFMQGRGQGASLFEAVFGFLPDVSWEATAHPNNFPSLKTQARAGFVCKKTAFVEEYDALRRFSYRPSNNDLEGQEKVRFSYSGREVRISDLAMEVQYDWQSIKYVE